MKKIGFVCAGVLLLAFAAGKAHAQSFMDRVHFEAAAGTGFKDDGTTPVDFSFKAHVDIIPALYAFIASEDNIALHKEGESKTYASGAGLGGGLGVKLLGRVKTAHALDLRAKVLGSLGDPDWERTTYDVSLAWYLKSARFSPVVEFGCRIIDSRTTGFANYGSAYVTFGLRY